MLAPNPAPPETKPLLLHGDCLALLPKFPADSVDAVVTDPPYGLEFMGKDWDGAAGFRRSLNEADVGRSNAFGRTSARAPEYRAGHLFQAWCEAWARECLRVLKPGGHLLAFGGSRTYHRLACAIEDAGFEIRDQVQWIYGSGFPKANTVLKPAHEPIVLARKPLIGTIVANVEKYGTGALNIETCRVDSISKGPGSTPKSSVGGRRSSMAGAMGRVDYDGSKGRFPANVIHDGSDEVLEAFPAAPGQLANAKQGGGTKTTNVYGKMNREGEASADKRYTDEGSTNFALLPGQRRTDSGSAASFFYQAKANKTERAGSKHPTVKPIALMRYLCRLVTPPSGVVLDPFAGTGTTGEAAALEGFRAILIEQNAEYVADIKRRLEK